jgi:hypothetical protein
MAVFTKQDRLEMSLKLVGIEDEIKLAEKGIVDATANEVDKTNKDEPIRKLIEDKTSFINPYQSELLLLDGITRSELTEAIMDDAALRIKNNSFFPNDPQTSLPSISDGIWKYFTPFAGNHAIGKTNFEVYPATGARTEQDIIDDINAEIALIEAEPTPNRATGQECNPGGSCSGETPPGSGTDESTCLANGGTWTPGADSYSADTSVVNALNNLKTLVQEWEDRINAEIALHPATEDDATRVAGNAAAAADASNATSIIDTWQAVQDFDTATSLPTGNDGAGCAAYDAMVEANFVQSKAQSTTLAPLKAELTARSAYIITRENELIGSGYLGSITQNLSTGIITTSDGLYGERMLLLDVRLNAVSGTLTAVKSAALGKDFQNQLKSGAENAESALSLAMYASKAIAPGINTKYLNIKDASGFTAGDRIYVAAIKQEELSGSIVSISGNRLELTFNIPKKYTMSNKTRVYKLL